MILLKKGKYLQYSSMVQCNSSAKRSNPFTPTLRMAKTFRVSHQRIEVHLFLSQTRVWARVNTCDLIWTFGIFTSSPRDTSDGQRPQLCCHAHGNLSFINRLLEFAVGKKSSNSSDIVNIRFATIFSKSGQFIPSHWRNKTDPSHSVFQDEKIALIWLDSRMKTCLLSVGYFSFFPLRWSTRPFQLQYASSQIHVGPLFPLKFHVQSRWSRSKESGRSL